MFNMLNNALARLAGRTVVYVHNMELMFNIVNIVLCKGPVYNSHQPSVSKTS